MPITRCQIHSPYALSKVVELLQGQTRARLGFKEAFRRSFMVPPPPDKAFCGTVGADSFSLNRNITYRNSFLPMIKGKIRAEGTGTVIDLVMHMHPLVVIFLIFWLGSLASIGLGMALANAEQNSWAAILIPAGMFMFGVALSAGAFIPEARIAKKALTTLLAPE